jgi:hypothetical protein
MPVVSNLQQRQELSMPACATQKTIADQPTNGNLFLPVPDTDFRDFLKEVDALSRFAPKIIEEIDKDLDVNSREKKKLRLDDSKFFENRTLALPDLQVKEAELLADELEMGIGRPRMQASLVYVFVMVRGFPGGSLASKTSRRFLRESMSLSAILIMAASRGTAGVEAGPPSRKTTVGWASGGSGSTPTA